MFAHRLISFIVFDRWIFTIIILANREGDILVFCELGASVTLVEFPFFENFGVRIASPRPLNLMALDRTTTSEYRNVYAFVDCGRCFFFESAAIYLYFVT